MNQTLLKTHKIECTRMLNMHICGLRNGNFNDKLAVYCIRISDFSKNLDALRLLLNEREILRAENYILEKDRNRFIVARSILKILLSRYLKKPANDIEFYFEENLKPRVKQKNSQIHFNVSHSGDMVTIAIGDSPVGIDVEFLDEEFNFESILEATFSESEIAFIHSNPSRTEAFYQLWTRKEALLKATGKGIDDSIPHIPSLNGSHEVEAALTDSDRAWKVGTFGIGSDYITSLAFHARTLTEPVHIYRTGIEVLEYRH